MKTSTHSIILLISLTLLASCVASPPKNTSNICSMFEEKRSWYKAALKSQKRWGVPVYVSMAFIKQESSYNGGAKPPRKKYFGFIPGRRPSSAYGYAQVLDGTWTDYKEAAGNWGARRNNFGDAVDFVGWYNNTSYRRNNLQRDDAYNLYLAYHEGHGGFSRGSYLNKTWLTNVARTVQNNSNRYQAQFQRCEADLGKNWFMRLFT